MSWKNNTLRYGSLSIGLHWLMFLLLAGVYVCIQLHEWYPKGSDTREALKTWHFMLGLSVFVLVCIRVVARLVQVMPAIDPEPVGWQNKLAKAVHLALYLLMIGMPLAGWFMLSAAGKPIPFWGLELPPLIGENESLAKQIKEIHETVGEIGLYVIGLHTVAALYHHYFLHDNTMLRMLPKKD
jgi:cytochrome b561